MHQEIAIVLLQVVEDPSNWRRLGVQLQFQFTSVVVISSVLDGDLAVFLSRVAIKRSVADLTVGAGFVDSPVLNCQHHGFRISQRRLDLALNLLQCPQGNALLRLVPSLWPSHLTTI